MDYADPQFRTKRPLRIVVLGASGVGKTSISLQFVTNEVLIATSPTTIEDNYRKEDRITVNDEEMIKRIRIQAASADNEEEVLIEEAFGLPPIDSSDRLTTADVSVTMNITDTAGYKCSPKADTSSSRSLLSRLTMRRKQGVYHVTLPERKRSEEEPVSCHHDGNDKERQRLDNCITQCDGAVLVYNVLDDSTFTAACDLRNRLVHLRNSIARKQQGEKKTTSNIFHKLGLPCCAPVEEEDVKIPPVFLVGTHADVRVEKMLNEKSSRIYDINFLHNMEGHRRERAARKRRVGKTLTSGRTSIHPHDVYPMISEWKECAGFAEITSMDAALVKQIFSKLSLAILNPDTGGAIE